jgi:hypothetical protein
VLARFDEVSRSAAFEEMGRSNVDLCKHNIYLFFLLVVCAVRCIVRQNYVTLY